MNVVAGPIVVKRDTMKVNINTDTRTVTSISFLLGVIAKSRITGISRTAMIDVAVIDLTSGVLTESRSMVTFSCTLYLLQAARQNLHSV
jgi:hypothetical protein